MQSPATPRQSSQCWALPKGSAQSFSARREGVLKVTAGRAWVTFGPGSRPATGHGPQSPIHEDMFLVAGARLPLAPGQTVVLEAWPAGSAAGTGLVWEPACAPRGAAGVGTLLRALARAGHSLVERLQARYGFAAPLPQPCD